MPEGRRLFAGMTVAENLAAGAYRARGQQVAQRLERVHDLFPVLAERRHRQQVGTLSGGEQQMCAIFLILLSLTYNYLILIFNFFIFIKKFSSSLLLLDMTELPGFSSN